ncbi:pre-rRNA-processing protein esf1 [Nicotiana tabacum]|uniref:Pre-rRNA-processing protein ESF1 n=1 Tax=Nicotiana sylvestris TaxID=4096 RepID=A0A1U7VYD1_NICSY|nr:PREDICTED: pre-rRNA-processing protein ESF1 [Nicotiana sylvestris]
MGSKNKDKIKKGKRLADTSTAAGDESGGGNRTEKRIINDSRFTALHSDPRFREPPKKKSKVTIDSRFNRMFTDKNFASSKAPTDIRGRPVNSSSSSRKNPLNHYYHLEKEEEEEEGEKQRKQKEKSKVTEPESEEEDAEVSESESGMSEEEIEQHKLKKVGAESSESEEEEDGEVEIDDSLASTEDSSSDSHSDDEMDEVYSEEEDTFVQKEDVPEIDKETKRLAIVNMDWGRVKAIDLYMLLSSFLPKGGQIISVAVYPSEFGLKRMEEEAVHGPVGLFDDENGKNEDSDDDDDDNDEIDNEKLRAYEMSRLRYYYAVVECDSSATADYLYKTCDGVEFERTSNKLDLRFIPDSMEFKHQARDIATEAPADYEGLDFHTRALQHSNIELTWDEDEPQRIRTLKRKFNADQLADMELKEFLASDDSESDDSEEGDGTEDKSVKKKKKQDRYRALLQSGEGSDGNNEDDDQDMEVTFNTGLEDLSKRILEKKDKQSETVWEAVLRKKREKKKARKGKSKDSSDDETSDSDQEPIEEPEDFFIEEPSKDSQHQSTRKGKQSVEASEEAEASRAELELLLADDKGGDANLKGYNMKPKKAKGKKGKELPNEDKLPSIDYEDPRFSSLFKSPLFALDPTDPQFKRSAVYARQLAQKQHKAEEEIVKAKQQPGIAAPLQPSSTLEAVTSEKLQSDNLPSTKEKHELSSLVKSIKMKSQQMSLPSQGKVVGKNEKSRARAKKIEERRK